jgi:hypothetical protein
MTGRQRATGFGEIFPAALQRSSFVPAGIELIKLIMLQAITGLLPA